MSIDGIELMKKIKENHRKLDGCCFHEFTIDATTDKKLDKRYRCVNCDGEVNAMAKHWYEKGIEQAKNYV
jgi:hypothetical protein